MDVFTQLTAVYESVQDRLGRHEPTSQAENAGSIPVIGSSGRTEDHSPARQFHDRPQHEQPIALGHLASDLEILSDADH
jgi:hypothetical protein